MGTNTDDDSSTSSVGSSKDDDVDAGIVETMPPSHFSYDGKHVHLPPPTDQERTRFFERSIARHGLLKKDMNASTVVKKETDESTASAAGAEDGEEVKKVKATPKIHPLALASARLQANGINELNRAINLHTLVATNEYFGLSNIVDPSLERLSSSATDKALPSSGNAGANDGQNVSRPGASAVDAAEAAVAPPMDEAEARVRAMYILKRNRAQFDQATVTLKRHCQRLAAATVAQQQVDRRLRQLRPVWRLVAPEHGTRALPHAVKPTEVVCADVDIYSSNQVGRLAGRVPRFATMELREDYSVEEDLKRWKAKYKLDYGTAARESKEQSADQKDTSSNAMDVEEARHDPSREGSGERLRTRAEPFSIADPSLGKVDTDFDPNNVAMLTLQCDIEKESTGFCVSARLQPYTRRVASNADNDKDDNKGDDENMLMALQHSLFSAKLFESIRRELAADTESIGQVRTTAKAQSAVWLTGESEDNYLPPPSLMISGPSTGGNAPLCIVHVHEGDVKVLLDCEYTLRVRLVESNDATMSNAHLEQSTSETKDMAIGSGSQSPEVLLNLCEALLLHMEGLYHSHSVQKEARLHMDKLAAEQRRIQFLKDNPHVRVAPPMDTKDATASPCTLQSGVSLGAKILFELRIRKVLKNVSVWLKATVGQSLADEPFLVEWLGLSVFDLTSHFTVAYLGLSFDANIVGDELTVTRFGDRGEYRKATFHSDKEFELFLKTSLKRVMQSA